MNDTPLIPASLYGLRTWRRAGDADGDVLLAAHQDTPWPAGGAWLHARCNAQGGHAAPDAGCICGIHAWHPRRSSARRVLAGRFAVPGIVEAAGAIELQDDGFRAERARPYAFVVTPGRNARLAERLARRYDAEVAEVRDADGLLAWCRERGLGLDERTVDELLGPERAQQSRAARRRRARRDRARVAGAVALSAAVLAAGAKFETGPPSPRGIYGRTGWVKRPSCAKGSGGRADARPRAASGRARTPC